MPTATYYYSTEEERLSIEAAIAYVCELRALAQTAPAGQVLAACETQALDQGRKLLRTSLQSAVQGRIDQSEKKGARPASAVRAPARSAPKGGAANAT